MNKEMNPVPVQEKNLTEKLYQIFLEEVSAYDFLAETIVEKQSAIVKNDLPKVENLTGIEQLIINKANTLSLTRHETLKSYFDMKGIKGLPLTISSFIDIATPIERGPWQKIDQRLNNAASKVRRLNAENERLLKSALQYVRGMIGLFYPKDEHAANMYTNEGKGNEKIGVKNLLNCNA